MINVRKRNGSLETLNVDKINVNVIRACENLEDVSANLIVANAKVQLYEGVTTVEIDKALISSAKSLIEKDPNYSFVAARLLLNTVYKEVFQESVDCELFDSLYRTAFVDNIMFMVEAGILDKRLLDYDLDFLCTKLVPSRDLLFQYLGIKVLSDRYFLRLNNKIVETPQAFWMRVCMGNCYNEGNKEDMVVKFYEKLSTLKLCPSTPTLFNSGSVNNQLSSCFLSSILDDSQSIMQTMSQQAQLSKHAGGLGLDVTPIRSAGSELRGVDNIAAGTIPYIKIFNDILTGFNQQGKRQGSGVVYLEIWHKDIEDFLDIKDHTGDDRRRAHEINTSTWIVDLFMEYVKADADWYLFCPHECPELHLIHNDEFKKAYQSRIDQAHNGKLKYWKTVKAKTLWKKILTKRSETGNFWQCHKDISNYCNPNQHYAPIRQSNLCCLAAGQRVPTQFGMLLIEDLAKLDKYLTVVGRDTLENASAMKLTLKNQKLIKVSTVEGYEQTMTFDHPLWVKDKGWVEAQHLTIGTQIECQSVKGIFGDYVITEKEFDDIVEYNFDPNYVPDIVWKATEKSVHEFLNRVGTWGNCIPYYVNSASKYWIRDIQILLSNFGIQSIIEEDLDGLSNIFYRLTAVVPKVNEDGSYNKYYATINTLEMLPEVADTYCLKVLSNPDHAWVCNGLITKNTEILEPSIPSTYTKLGDLQTLGETATCTLASTNLVAHADENGKIDYSDLADTCYLGVRWLDNCVTNQWLPTYEAQNGSNKHRYIGFGRMGFQDILHLQKISFNSKEAVDLSNKISEFISQYSILASSKLAKERGKYSTYEGSLWDQGIFPQDIHSEYLKRRKIYHPYTEGQPWITVREHVRKYGIRNANIMAIAPTASIADICGVEQSIEPNYAVLNIKQGLSGENTIFNRYFVKEMKERGLWNSKICQDIKQTDGDLRKLNNIPEDLKERYSRCFDKDMFNLIRCCAAAQHWIDQGISFNLYANQNSMKYLNDLYFYCWEQGLKTTYYLRTEAASKVKKVTINTLEQSVCSIEAMKRGESCESCS